MAREPRPERASVVLANHAEFNRSTMWGFNSVERISWDKGANALAEQALFWGVGDTLAVVPSAPDPLFLEDIAPFCPPDTISWAASGEATPFLGRAALADSALFERIALHLSRSGENLLTGWGLTIGLAKLIEALRKRGCRFETPDLPPAESWPFARNLDSKAGGRTFLENSGLPMADGFVLTSLKEAAEAAAYFFKAGKGVAIKANHGAGGYGVFLAHPETCGQSAEKLAKALEMRARMEGFWRSSLFVVEELYPDSPAITADLRILPDGAVKLIGLGLMLIRQERLYQGILAGRGALAEPLSEKCGALAEKIGRALHREGYTGWLNVDFIVDGKGEPLVAEINLRRSCPSHAFDFAAAHFGEGWETHHAIEALDYLYFRELTKPLTYSTLSPVFRAFNEANRQSGTLAFPTSATQSLGERLPHLGFLVAAPDALSASAAAKALSDQLLMAAGCGL